MKEKHPSVVFPARALTGDRTCPEQGRTRSLGTCPAREENPQSSSYGTML